VCVRADFLTGVILAVDVAATLGMASRSKLRFFRPAQCGALGAVAAMAKLSGMDAAGINNALGVLLGQLSGTMQAHREGVALLPMQIAFNARNAILAHDLALAGLTGPLHSLEGEFGYLKLFEGEFDLATATADLGTVWRITQVSHKPFPSGRATHGGLAALQNLLKESVVNTNDIVQIVLHAPPLICQLVDRPSIAGMSSNYAKLCFAYTAACVLDHGAVTVDDFAMTSLDNARLQTLAERVSVVTDTDPNALTPQRLELRLRDGQVWQKEIPALLGSPQWPLSQTAHFEKYFANVDLLGSAYLARGQRLKIWVDELPTQSDMEALWPLLVA
jgi:aconitate decarboxylase